MILERPLLKSYSISVVCHAGRRYISLCLWWNILHWAGVLQHQRPSVWADGPLLLYWLAVASARLSHTHADVSWLILLSPLIKFQRILVWIISVKSWQNVVRKSTICLICELHCSMVTHWGIAETLIRFSAAVLVWLLSMLAAWMMKWCLLPTVCTLTSLNTCWMDCH